MKITPIEEPEEKPEPPKEDDYASLDIYTQNSKIFVIPPNEEDEDGEEEQQQSKQPLLEKKEPSPAHKKKAREPTTYLRLFICFFGIQFCYLLYGYIQEELFRPDPKADNKKFDNTLFLFGIQSLMNALFALSARTLFGGSKHAKPLAAKSETSPLRNVNGWLWLAVISASYLLAMLTSNEALKYVSYPVQALAKSCKMVPVMLGNVLVGVKYRPREYVIVVMIAVGVMLSQPEPKAGGSESTLFGMGLLFLSLMFDGVTGSHQHLFDHEYQLSTHDLMLGMNAFSSLYTFIALALTGEGWRGLEYVLKYPHVQMNVFLFGLMSALGQNFIFYTITGPGPLVCTTITTMRKFFTILLSVFSHPDNSLSQKQWFGVFLVFGGLGSEILEKALKSRSSKKVD